MSGYLAFPLRYSGGKFATVEVDTVEHAEQRGEVLLRTRRGMFDADPEFGIADLVGRLGPVAPEVQAAIDRFVDGALVATEDADSVRSRLREVAVSIKATEEPV